MMEFTMSRVLMCACGVMILAILINPVSSLYDDRYDNDMRLQSERICEMIDSFGSSDMESITVSGADLIPEGCVLIIEDDMIILEHDGKEYIAYTLNEISSIGSYGSNDTIYFQKEGDIIRMTSI